MAGARLTYADALLPHALLLAGAALGGTHVALGALELLAWLVQIEQRHGWFSFTPTGGWTTGERRPGFDQQPIEAATMADACWSAYEVTRVDAWARLVILADEWFRGRNDTGTALYVEATGSGHDGLTPRCRNENQGAESTIAAISTRQLERRLVLR